MQLQALNFPLVMGILNLTPDSFSDGGRYMRRDAALRRALDMVDEGAAILDIGGESTRPGAAAVGVQEELDRVLPLVEAIRAESTVPISIDTSKPGVMRQGVAAGADMINDVCALEGDGALAAAAAAGVPVCLMHMRGTPRTMQADPQYVDVVTDISTYLSRRVDACVAAGIARQDILLDPGFGFGKTLAHNLALLARLDVFAQLGLPLLVGISRKSMIGALTGRDPEGRLPGSLAAAVLALERGAAVLRVHDVAPTVDALKVWQAVRETPEQEKRDA